MATGRQTALNDLAVFRLRFCFFLKKKSVDNCGAEAVGRPARVETRRTGAASLLVQIDLELPKLLDHVEPLPRRLPIGGCDSGARIECSVVRRATNRMQRSTQSHSRHESARGCDSDAPPSLM